MNCRICPIETECGRASDACPLLKLLKKKRPEVAE